MGEFGSDYNLEHVEGRDEWGEAKILLARRNLLEQFTLEGEFPSTLKTFNLKKMMMGKEKSRKSLEKEMRC